MPEEEGEDKPNADAIGLVFRCQKQKVGADGNKYRCPMRILLTLSLYRKKCYLKMPEEEGEDEPDADAHDPGHQHKHQEPDVREGLKEKVVIFSPETWRIFLYDIRDPLKNCAV
jgi:hypothetical protein